MTQRYPVLVVTRHYSPEPTGSAPPMRELAEWLAASHHPATVVTSRPSYPERFVTPGYANGERDDAIEGDVRVLRWATTPAKGAGLLSRVVPEARFMLQLVAARLSGRVKRADTIVSLCPSILTVIGARFLLSPGGRHVAVIHDVQSGLGAALGSWPVRILMSILRRIESWTLNRVDHLIVLSMAMDRALRAQGIRTPATILPPQIDCRAIRPLPWPSGAPVLMYSGNLGRKQGLDQVLDLGVELKRRRSGARIVIRGEGALRDTIAHRISAERLENISLEPLAPMSALSESLAEATIHLVPQIADGGDFAVPSKAFAIMAAGRPFIATADATSSISKLAAETGAFLCTPPNDPEAFADTIEALLEDIEKCRELARRGRDYAERHADTDVVMKQIETILQGGGAKPT